MYKIFLGIDGFGGGPEGIHENLKNPDAEQGFWQKHSKTFENVMF